MNSTIKWIKNQKYKCSLILTRFNITNASLFRCNFQKLLLKNRSKWNIAKNSVIKLIVRWKSYSNCWPIFSNATSKNDNCIINSKIKRNQNAYIVWYDEHLYFKHRYLFNQIKIKMLKLKFWKDAHALISIG